MEAHSGKNLSDTTAFGESLGDELVFALVGPVGADLAYIQRKLSDELKAVGYSTVDIRLSSILESIEIPSKSAKRVVLYDKPEDKRISSYMDAGNTLRRHTGRGDALAVLAINVIREKRQELQKNKVAYILNSLKHPDEVNTLRRIYREGFFLIGVHSSYDRLRASLAEKIAADNNSAKKEDFYNVAEGLIKRDHEEPDDLGQQVSDTFHLADIFVSLQDRTKASKNINRFIELIFGNTFHTPTRHEYCMFFAHAAARRSSALARQVGAIIATRGGEVLSVGTNDVPTFGGGLYWGEDENNDHRDHKKDFDSNTREINEIIEEILEVLKRENLLAKKPLKVDVRNIFRKTKLMNITEYGRMVHAEMDAILQAARQGIAIKGTDLFTTVFPCHNCAKHIVAAGISRVFYVEPYPKSLAPTLHEDSIIIDGSDNKKVSFKPFMGIGPRRYLDLFSLITSTGEQFKRKDDFSGDVIKWDAQKSSPRQPLFVRAYLDKEKLAIAKINSKIKNDRRDNEKNKKS